MSPALAVHDETPSPNLKVTSNPLKARLLFTVPTFHVTCSELRSPQQQEHSWASRQLSPPCRAQHLLGHTKTTPEPSGRQTAGTKDQFAGLCYRSSTTILTLVTGRATQALALQHSSNPAHAALKSELQVFSKGEQPSLHVCLLSTW